MPEPLWGPLGRARGALGLGLRAGPPHLASGTYLYVFFQIGFRLLPDVCSGLICLMELAVSQILSLIHI
mgnify:CR=1 FL=1